MCPRWAVDSVTGETRVASHLSPIAGASALPMGGQSESSPSSRWRWCWQNEGQSHRQAEVRGVGLAAAAGPRKAVGWDVLLPSAVVFKLGCAGPVGPWRPGRGEVGNGPHGAQTLSLTVRGHRRSVWSTFLSNMCHKVLCVEAA